MNEEANELLPTNPPIEDNEDTRSEIMEEGILAQEPSSVYQTFAFVWEILKIVLVALVIIIPIRYLLIQPFYVNGASMEPTFNDADYIMINEFTYKFIDGPKRGDIVIFRFPNDKKEFFIKRVIGLPEEIIEIENNEVRVFNKENETGLVLDESDYLASTVHTSSMAPRKLDDNEYFVLGDNRSNSSDSRFWGPVNKSLITGKVFFRAWPFSEPHTFDQPIYE